MSKHEDVLHITVRTPHTLKFWKFEFGKFEFGKFEFGKSTVHSIGTWSWFGKFKFGNFKIGKFEFGKFKFEKSTYPELIQLYNSNPWLYHKIAK